MYEDQLFDELNEDILREEEGGVTNELCPACGEPLYLLSIGSSPDDYINELHCYHCNYKERD